MIGRYVNVVNPFRWTPTARECFKRGCVCEGCFYKEFFTTSSFQCRMKGSVVELVKKFGVPEDLETKTIIGDD